jgi:hypothetical protein
MDNKKQIRNKKLIIRNKEVMDSRKQIRNKILIIRNKEGMDNKKFDLEEIKSFGEFK